jgi:enoyl-CoA hydratase
LETLLYETAGPIATITLHRPDRLNTIVPPMPDEFETAIRDATLDSAVKVIVLRGAGRSFCAGYDFGGGFHQWDEAVSTDGPWDPGKDFAWAASPYGPTQKFMSMWRTPKPVIAQVHGWCVGGGSDMARRARAVRGRAGRATGRDPLFPTGRHEADRQPGLREHGATRHPDAGPDPRRPDAQYP